MKMYINEVGNLSLYEANEIDELVGKTQQEIISATHLLEHCCEMIDQLKMMDLANQVKHYNNQKSALLDELTSKHLFLGHCWTYFGDPFSSNEAYYCALKLDENNADLLTYVGRNHLQLGNYDEAKTYLTKAFEIKPTDPLVLFYFAECFQALGEMEFAEEKYRDVLKSGSTSFEDLPTNHRIQNQKWERFKRFARPTVQGLHNIRQWRESVSIGEDTEKDFKRLERIADGRPIFITHICGNGQILSHMVNQIEVFVRHLHLRRIEDPFIIILNPDKFVNEALVEMYDRKLWLIDSRFPYLRKRLVNLREWLVSVKSPVAVDIDPYNPRPHVVNFWAPQMRCWIEGPQTLEFSYKELEKGEQLFRELEILADDEFVCLGIRESNYYDSVSSGSREKDFYWMSNIENFEGLGRDNEELGALSIDFHQELERSHRLEALKTPLENYLPMAEKLAKNGIYVLRMGLSIDKSIPAKINKRVVDYASKFRSDFGDVFLSAKCKFAIAGGTGSQWISCAFGRPVVNTDMYLPNNAFLNTSPNGFPNLSIPRKYWYIEERRFLTYSEVFKVFRRYQNDKWCASEGIENVANTAEEITDVVIEMNSRIDGNWKSTSEDNELQEKYRKLHSRKDDAFGSNGLIGAQFLRDNVDLIR